MTMRIPYAPLKVVFFLHLVLIVWASQGTWLPTSYLAYNGLLLFTLLWTIHSRDSEEGPFMGICVNAASILLDVVTMAIFWPSGTNSGLRWFGGLCCVVNLLLRPVTSYMLYRILQDRAATYGNFSLPAGLDNLFPSNMGGSSRSPYEDIDQTTSAGAAAVPPHTLGADSMMPSPTHQPLQPAQQQQPYHAKEINAFGQ